MEYGMWNVFFPTLAISSVTDDIVTNLKNPSSHPVSVALVTRLLISMHRR